MPKDPHFTSLENMYLAAPINAFFEPKIEIAASRATVKIDVAQKLFHAAGAVHGSVYFKMLDDAAFFAANSLEKEFFVLTTTFTTYITRPVSAGVMRSVGRVVNQNKSQFIVEAIVYDVADREVGRGSGIFVRGKMRLTEAQGYGPG